MDDLTYAAHALTWFASGVGASMVTIAVRDIWRAFV